MRPSITRCTTPVSSSTFRCLEIAGLETPKPLVASPTVAGPPARRSTMPRRMGWARALNGSLTTGLTVAAVARSVKPLLEQDPAERGRHPRALVQAEGARLAAGVDPEAGAALAALPEAAERILQQRRADAPPAPRAAGEELVHEAAAVGVAGADRPGGDLAAGADHAPQRRVEALALQVAPRPGLERLRRVLPVVGERLLLGGVEAARVALRLEGHDLEPVRPHGGGRPG